jgi:hypothetical protein
MKLNKPKKHWCHETAKLGRLWQVFAKAGAALERPFWLGFAAVSAV